MKKRYTKNVSKVFGYIGMDKEIISSVASMCDMVEDWNNPDDEDYVAAVESRPLPAPYLFKGKMHVNKYKHELFMQSFSNQIFSHEIRSHKTLAGLSEMYKRLKTPSSEIPASVFQNIARKMFWLCLQEETACA